MLRHRGHTADSEWKYPSNASPVHRQMLHLTRVVALPSAGSSHGDDTPVFWRFGFDLTARLRKHGFEATLLSTDRFIAHVRSGARDWPEPTSPEFDVRSMTSAAVLDDLASVANDDVARALGLLPAYMFLTWECFKATR